MNENSFDLFITLDKNLPYQNTIESSFTKIVVLKAENNRLETLVELLPKLFNVLLDNTNSIIEIS